MQLVLHLSGHAEVDPAFLIAAWDRSLREVVPEPVIVMPRDAKYSAFIRSCGVPDAGRIMCRLMIIGSPWIVVM